MLKTLWTLKDVFLTLKLQYIVDQLRQSYNHELNGSRCHMYYYKVNQFLPDKWSVETMRKCAATMIIVNHF